MNSPSFYQQCIEKAIPNLKLYHENKEDDVILIKNMDRFNKSKEPIQF